MKETLKDKTVKGLFWGGMSNGLQQLLNLIFGIFLGRLLSPSDYGMIGMLTIFSLIAGSLQESGFTAAIANKKDVSHRDYNAVFWFSILVSATLYFLLFMAAPIIAAFYHTPELTPLARYSFLGFLISSFGTAHFAKLFREMKVKQRTITTFTALCISGIIGVTMAFLGFSYWGIATQNLCYILITTCLFWYFSGWRPTFIICFTPIKEMFGFSCKLLATNVFIHINNNLFSVILGKFFNENTVGYYTQGNKWNTMGHNLITGMVNSVAQPVFAKVKDDQERQLRVFRKMLKFTAFIAFPLMLGLCIISRELITILITEKWLTSADILSILCIGGAFLPITNLYSNFVISKGKSDIYLYNTIAVSILQLCSLLVLYRFGIETMLYGYIGINIAWLLIWHHFVKKEIHYSYWQALIDILYFLFSACIVMIISNYLGNLIDNTYLRMGAKILLAVTLYTLFMIRNPMLKEAISYLHLKKI
jgi:O-antigen/teichoic acid export membrane protein